MRLHFLHEQAKRERVKRVKIDLKDLVFHIQPSRTWRWDVWATIGEEVVADVTISTKHAKEGMVEPEDELWVYEPYRRQGVGMAMLKFIEDKTGLKLDPMQFTKSGEALWNSYCEKYR